MGMEFDFSKLQPMDILDLAIYAEEEAKTHYETLASWAAGQSTGEVVSFLKRMAELEAAHRETVHKLRQRRFGDTPANFTENVAWDIETPNYDEVPETMTIRQALEIARDSEVKAYEYYTQAKEYFDDDESLEVLETLRKAELNHKRMIEEELAKLP